MATFTDLHKERQQSRVYILFMIESTKRINDFKYDNKKYFANIFDRLVQTNTFLSYDKFRSHREHCTSFFQHKIETNSPR